VCAIASAIGLLVVFSVKRARPFSRSVSATVRASARDSGGGVVVMIAVSTANAEITGISAISTSDRRGFSIVAAARRLRFAAP
jgi:hypothetical protein